VLVILMLAYGTYPDAAGWLLVFPLTALAVVAAAGVGSWLAALNVKYRDVRFVIPFLTQLWLFATPVIYPATIVPQPWRTVYALNPMAGVVEGFRWALVGAGSFPGRSVAVSAGVSLALLAAGVLYFHRTEDRIADVV
jgi:lipopolysaccharide transport system permease protein